MQTSHFLLFSALGIIACGAAAKNDPKDPNAPALEPAVVTAKPGTPATPLVAPTTPGTTLSPADPLQRTIAVSAGYSLAAAMMINQDARMLAGLYASDALLSLPDTSVRGVVAIARQLTALAKAKSLAEFQRRTQGMRILDDSTFADSGTYVMILKRTPKDSVFERGRYAATWRARTGGPGNWVMLEDRIRPDIRKSGK